MRIRSLRPTQLFVDLSGQPAQVLQVALAGPAADPALLIEVSAAGTVVGTAAVPPGSPDPVLEVPLPGLAGREVGELVPLQVRCGETDEQVELRVGEPGWTVWMIPHFHYDPVWWNTQAAYTCTWDDLGEAAQRTRSAFQQSGFTLVDAHLAEARRDPDYRFVLAEVDYLKPYWDSHPQQRGFIRRLLAEGRLEIMGGTYNEPNTNLTTAETTARNFVYGSGFQRDVLGGDPHTAWQLDVFGHDPQFPGLAAEAGLTSSSWARGPFHQWGPMLSTHAPVEGWGDPSSMQFPAEFEWVSPSGKGVLTHYMPAHYSAGWQIDSATTLEQAQSAVHDLFELLARVASTRNVLLPVGTDYTPPSKWVTRVQRDWNARYVSPRFVTALPREFFAAVRAELSARGATAVPQTRDMNPLYTGKDVSYIDTKQAQRATESLLVDAELFATMAALRGAAYPHAAVDKAWRQLVYGAHHDAITGSESDQVYLDLVTGWREAHDLSRAVLSGALDHLAAALPAGDVRDGVPVTVFNPSSWDRDDLVAVEVDLPLPPGRDAGAGLGLAVLDPAGRTVPCTVEHLRVDGQAPDGGTASRVRATVTFLARAQGLAASSGWRVQLTTTPAEPAWVAEPGGLSVHNDRYRLRVDPQRGGCVEELVDLAAGRSLLQDGQVGNELVLEQEYPEHPTYHEGPWHLVPTGRKERSSSAPATSVVTEHGPLGSRVTVTGRLGGFGYRQRITLWHGLDRVDCRTTLEDFDGVDQLVRLRWPVSVPGALPVSEVADAVVGRGFGLIDVDSAEHPWTLDNPANSWFALSSTARVRVATEQGDAGAARAIGIAELVAADLPAAAGLRELAVALVGQGVTSTTSVGSGPRYGVLSVDSNLPDVRISVGGPGENPFTAALLQAADEEYAVELDKQLAAGGPARVWVPARAPLSEVWVPGADLSGVRDLPVLVLAGDGAVETLVADLADGVVEVQQHARARTPGEADHDDYTVGLVNTGMPGFAVEPNGALNLSLVRSCTGWPSGVWIDPPRRTTPDGSNFQQQHWTHTFEYSVLAGQGDWRAVGLVRAGHEVNHPLHHSLAAPAAEPGTGQAPGRPAADGAYPLLRLNGPAMLGALKPTGNPLARGQRPGDLEGISVRLYEPHGRQARAVVDLGVELSGQRELDLLEEPRQVGGTQDDAPSAGRRTGVEVELGPMQIATLGAVLAQPVPAVAEDAATAHEPHQPVYSRYWLNNTGPAPRGNLPVAVHLEPQVLTRPVAGGTVTAGATLASDLTDSAAEVSWSLLLPEGWGAQGLGASRVPLDAGGHHEVQLELDPGEAGPGVYWVRLQAQVDGQTVEDVLRVIIGDVAETELTVTTLTPQLQLAPGEQGRLEVRLDSTAATATSAQVQLVSPWQSWDLLPEWNTGAELAARGSATLDLPVRVPASAEPGSWWVLVKVASAGLLHYGQPIRLEVRRG